MTRLLSVVLVLGLLALPTVGQATQQVIAIGVTFQDTTSGTNITTITFGDTVEWLHVSGGFHTVTSGTGAGDPDSGNLFDSTLNAGGMFSYTPTNCGSIDYYCIPHEAFLMVGTIIVVAPTPMYPGSGEDFEMGTAINNGEVTFEGCADVKNASGGDSLVIVARSPNGTFDFCPLLVVAQEFMGSPPIGTFGLHVNTMGGFIVAGGGGSYALQVVPGTGSIIAVEIPPAIPAGTSIIIQCLALKGTASNGFFAITSAHRIDT